VKAAGNIDAFAGKLFANAVCAVYATFYKILDEVGAVKCR
jgi:hypothetical protein